MEAAMKFSRRLRNRWVITGIVVVIVAVGGAFYARSPAAGVQYRTARVALGTVTQSLVMSGNLMPSKVSDINFAVAGTVASIPVTVGQTIAAGTVLATLDPTPLQNALTISEAQLASAQAQLAQDEAGPTADQLAQANNSVALAELSLSSAQTNLADTEAINAQTLSEDAALVTTAQNQVNSDSTTLAAAEQQQTTACSGTGQGSSSCQAASTQVTNYEQQLGKDTQALQEAQYTVAAAQLKNTQSIDQGNEQIATAQQQLVGAKDNLAAIETPATPAQLQSARSEVAIDEINVNQAAANLANATLTSPVDGVVAQINLTVGSQVTLTTAALATPHFVIIGRGTFSVDGTISDAQIGQVALGQSAVVVPAGATQSLLGTVSAIAPEATINSGVATFPVTVTVSDPTGGVHAGASATVNIIVNRAINVLTVPTSVVHTTPSGTTVDILRNGKSVPVAVQLGASDQYLTQILSGLNLGQTVIIAVVSNQIPTTTIPTGKKGLFGGGAFPRSPKGGKGGKG